MTASEKLDQYLGTFATRLKHVRLARGTAVLSIALLVLAVLAAYIAIASGFDNSIVIGGRLVLLICIAAIVYLLILKPVRHLRTGAAAAIEARAPSFGGRVLTYMQLRDKANPFRELLARDTLSISTSHPVAQQVQQREFTLPGAIAGASIAVLLALILAGPGLLNYGLRHLLAGWAFSDLLPPQTISVSPGDELVRRGGNVRVQAEMSGFNPGEATVHVKMGANDWQEVSMVRRPEGFEFTFFSVREAMQYYVSSMGIRSPAYEIEVVELPGVRSINLTYTYPEWTQREPERIEFGGDISTVQGTGVDMQVITDTPLPGGLLMLDEDGIVMNVNGDTATAGFTVEQDGQYYIAARVGNETVRLTDDYFITVVEDTKPDIKLVRPGRDWNASNIEEVTARLEVADDYALQSLNLHYSVNGGDWQTVPLAFTDRQATVDHVFYLEEITTNITGSDSTLVPGDLISYYAEATDRMNTAQTDMFFIQVQPFDRRYTQSQQMGGGGGGGGQSPQQEISQRQKEIIVSTWNLIREQNSPEEKDALTIQDNATLLSDLQNTLADQATTLAERTRARQLTSVDDQIGQFVEHLEQAVESMRPAAERLAGNDLQEAIKPEQEALQHLLRAEAMFNDIQVSFQRGQGGGGGFSAGRDLAEMFELEMDLEKNQYETGSSASRQSSSQAVDEAMQKLEELARRQEQLANNFQRQQQMTPAQRWQQEMLRRDAEELQRQLEQLQRQQQQSTSTGSNQGQSQGQSGEGTGQQSGEPAQSELSRRLGSAIRAMNEASEAMRNNGDSRELQRAVQEAQRQLEEARNQVAQDQQQAMQQSFQDMADRAADLHRQQSRIDQRLQDAVREALAGREKEDDPIMNPLSYSEEAELAQQKRDMLQELQSLRQQLQSGARNFNESSPEAARELARANDELRDTDIDTRLTIAASYIEQGAGLYIASSESVVTSALRNLQNRLYRAESMAAGGDPSGQSNLERALSQTRDLRRQLQELTGPQNEQVQDVGQPGGNNRGDVNNQNLADGPVGGQQQDGPFGYGGWDGWRRPVGIVPPEFRQQINRDIYDTAGIVNPIIPELREQGLSEQDIDEIYRILRELTYAPMDDEKNELILQDELTKRLALLEQLELQLERGSEREATGTIRSEVSEPVPAQYRERVAEYYRRLSEE